MLTLLSQLGDTAHIDAFAVRDLLRKRSQLVRQRTSQVLSIENLMARSIGLALNSTEVKQLTLEAVQKLVLR